MFTLNTATNELTCTDGRRGIFQDGDPVYVDYLAWNALDTSSNVLNYIDVPAPVRVTSVTMRQARLALLGAGLLGTVNSAIAGMQGAAGEAARITREFSSEVHRDSAFIAQIQGGLGMTSAQIDALFLAASKT